METDLRRKSSGMLYSSLASFLCPTCTLSSWPRLFSFVEYFWPNVFSINYRKYL